MSRVMVAMSGGVDSSVAAHLLLEQGHDCLGVTMRLHGTGIGTQQDIADAQAVAARLGIEHEVVDLSRAFDQLVIEPFARDYEAGKTPSPCVGCNRTVKFGLLLDHALEAGCDYLATGHYAQVGPAGAPGRRALLRGADRNKDQSYMLCLLTQDQLARTLLPLGRLDKPRVRTVAQELGLSTAHKSESQDICFVPEGDHVAFLERRRGRPFEPGDVLDTDGRTVGRHRGAACYTIGQRKGLGVALGEPAFVCAKDMGANTVTLGFEDALMSTSCLVEGWNWIAEPASAPLCVTAKTHYRHHEQPAVLVPLANGAVRIDFERPQRAVAPGQFAVAYQGERVVGGGAIAQTLRSL